MIDSMQDQLNGPRFPYKAVLLTCSESMDLSEPAGSSAVHRLMHSETVASQVNARNSSACCCGVDEVDVITL